MTTFQWIFRDDRMSGIEIRNYGRVTFNVYTVNTAEVADATVREEKEIDVFTVYEHGSSYDISFDFALNAAREHFDNMHSEAELEAEGWEEAQEVAEHLHEIYLTAFETVTERRGEKITSHVDYLLNRHGTEYHIDVERLHAAYGTLSNALEAEAKVRNCTEAEMELMLEIAQEVVSEMTEYLRRERQEVD